MNQLDIAWNIPIFAGLSKQEKAVLLQQGNILFYPQKEYIFKQGDAVKYFYVVCSGVVQEFRQTTDGREITVSIHKVGDIPCKTEAFLMEGIHQTNAVATHDVYVMELPIDQFKKDILKYSSVANSLLFSLAQFSFMKQMEVEQQATMSAAEMVAFFLRQLCDSHGLDPCGFTLPYKKSLIASRLGMELETLSRTLPKLEDFGITVKGTQVSFHGAENRMVSHSSVVPFRTSVKQ